MQQDPRAQHARVKNKTKRKFHLTWFYALLRQDSTRIGPMRAEYGAEEEEFDFIIILFVLLDFHNEGFLIIAVVRAQLEPRLDSTSIE